MRTVNLTISIPTLDLPDTLRDATAAFAARAVSMFDIAKLWQRRHNERRHLAGLDPRLLADSGVTTAFVTHEIAKPFWQA